MILPCLFIAPAGEKGRGVFTAKALAKNTIIEIAPVIVMNPEDRLLLDKTVLYNYIFEWGPDKRECAMALGYVPVYNHSYRSNCEYEMDFDAALITIKTMRTVKRHEELLINYNGDWNDDTPLWFDAR